MRVVFAEAARSDLIRIGDYIAQHSPTSALNFVRELRRRALMLQHMPLAYPVISRFRQSGLRRRSFRNYLIFYRVEVDRIVIVRILHGAQDFDPLLFPE